ncbi:hypothetical protein SARC_03549 [Sphaeroforma arctica JP610]|uniref:Uncharacterized protein n=1 Tax=Sphaeroforma arctica JP610 TaxID=667725 RepID=A0A0L0G5A0_9EUKA|nr:hypothetical protein SARC_03549 [Sphaeroforma arctica JP610]KNC84217.1 hypothetical protein SARC_03549 [Sphaeroforma arctica JP610]|eukprot:XP_014158119.1 hypothetical protein SARC_03549 [Sphaeroforma arctica JP610]
MFNKGRSFQVQGWATRLDVDQYFYHKQCQKLAKKLFIVGIRSIVLQLSMELIEEEERALCLSTYESAYYKAASVADDHSGTSSRRQPLSGAEPAARKNAERLNALIEAREEVNNDMPVGAAQISETV